MTPMMWMGRFSAITAFAMGAFFAGFAVLQLSWNVVSWQLMLGAALLMIGAFRTLTGMPGGLRLLCGAWGFAAGVSLAPGGALVPASEGYAMVTLIARVMITAVPIISLGGLALTVLHKERK